MPSEAFFLSSAIDAIVKNYLAFPDHSTRNCWYGNPSALMPSRFAYNLLEIPFFLTMSVGKSTKLKVDQILTSGMKCRIATVV